MTSLDAVDFWHFNASLCKLDDAMESIKLSKPVNGIVCVMVRHVRCQFFSRGVSPAVSDLMIDLEVVDDSSMGNVVHIAIWGQVVNDVLRHRIQRGSFLFLRHLKLQRSLSNQSIRKYHTCRANIIAFCKFNSFQIEWLDRRFQTVINTSDLNLWEKTLKYLANDASILPNISTYVSNIDFNYFRNMLTDISLQLGHQ